MRKHMPIFIWGAILVFGIVFSLYLGGKAMKTDMVRTTILGVSLLGAGLFFRLGLRSEARKKTRFFIPWMTIPILLLAVWAANMRLFGAFDVSAVLFHMSHSLYYDGVVTDIIEFSVMALIGLAIIGCVVHLGRRDMRVKIIDKLIAIPLLLANPVAAYTYDTVLVAGAPKGALLDLYVEPKIIAAPDVKKNLILIYLESTEDTYSNAYFGDIFSELEAVASQGLRIKGMHTIRDTGWTIAGIVSSQCGIPLLSYGLVMQNRFKNIDTMLPNVKCLGEVMQEQGYEVVFLGGASLTFAAKGEFLKTHGYTKMYGLKDFPVGTKKNKGDWGVFDDVLYDRAFEEIGILRGQDKPYLFSMLTIAGHTPHGFPAPSCYEDIKGAQEMNQMLLAIQCTGVLLQKFLTRLDTSGYLENTAVVIVSDHLSRLDPRKSHLGKFDRQYYGVILDADIQTGVVQTNGTMLDMFPTILNVLGYEVPGDSAGLGRSLLSGTPSLYEELGPKKLNKYIASDKALREKIWNINSKD